MKKLLMVLALSASSMAFADHGLDLAMKDSAQIKTAVQTAIKKKGVVCDVKNSIQMAATVKGAAWRQVALCYPNKEMMKVANDTLAAGNSLGGAYGIPASTILDIEYSENTKTSRYDKVMSLTLK